jgi:hypothetical protein
MTRQSFGTHLVASSLLSSSLIFLQACSACDPNVFLGEDAGENNVNANTGDAGQVEGNDGGTNEDGSPAATIISPSIDSQYALGESITFSGSASDNEDGALSGVSLAWSSSLDGSLGTGGTVVNALVTVGTHTISFAATDSDGLTGLATVSIEVVDNFVPVVSLLQPADGSFHHSGDSILFQGSAADSEDGNITGTQLTWFNGPTQIGSGATVQTALANGTHEVTLQAVDSENAIGTATITIHIVDNFPPVCSILSPADGTAVLTGETVAFEASCTDPDVAVVPNINISWTSDLQGNLGVGALIQTALLDVGFHTIEVCAIDSEDATVVNCTSLQVNVLAEANEPPTAMINAPANSGVHYACEAITLECNASDAENQIAGVQWSSNLEGVIGSSEYILWTPSIGGQHTLTCTATDASGQTAEDTVSVIVVSPFADVNQPTSGAQFAVGASIPLAGTACDSEDGALAGSNLTWHSSVRGQIGSGATSSFTESIVGFHQLQFRALDSENNAATVSLNVSVHISVGGNLVDLVENVSLPGDGNGGIVDPSTGMIWIATDNGLVRIDPADPNNPTVYTSDNSDLPDNQVLDVVLAADGTLMIATDDGLAVGCATVGLSCQDTFSEGDLALNDNKITAIVLLPDGRTVIGTDDCLMFSDWSLDEHIDICDGDGQGDNLIGSEINGLFYDEATGGVWVATSDGASFMEPTGGPGVGGQSSSTFTSYDDDDGLADKNVSNISVGSITGDVWFATEGGLTRMTQNPQAFSSYTTGNGLPSNRTNDVAIDIIPVTNVDHEIVWAATQSGLVRIDPILDTLMVISTNEGLPGNNCQSVDVGPSHTKYIGTTQGLGIYTGW